MDKKQITVLVGMAGTLVLAAAKTALSFISGSTALLADALHSFSDGLVSLLVLIGLKLHKKKIEAAVTLTVGILIISVAIGFATELFFREQPPIRNILWTVLGQIAIIIITYVLYRYKTVIGLEEHSESLIADGAHTKSDMFSSVGVLLSLTGSLIGLNLDKGAAFIIFFLILYQGLETILSGVYLFRKKEEFHFNAKKISDFLLEKFKTNKKIYSFLLILFLFFLFILPGFYRIEQNQKGIRTVFGIKREVVVAPGLHFDPFYLFSEIERVPTGTIHSLEYGFSIKNTDTDDIMISQMETIHNSKHYEINSYEENFITGDGSIVNINIIIEYIIDDPYNFLSRTESPEIILKVETGSQLQKITGSMQLFDVLNKEREFIEEELTIRLNNSMKQLQTGIFIKNTLIYSISPHLNTVYMYRNVQDAEQQKEILLYNAESVRSKQIPYYRGLAYEKKINAGAQAIEIILKAERDVAQYKLLEKIFEQNKEAVIYRMALDSRVRMLKDKEKILIENSLEEDKLRLNYQSRKQ